MRTFFDRIGACAMAILILLLIEGLITFGSALEFERYDTISWVAQGLMVYVACWGAVRIQEAK